MLQKQKTAFHTLHKEVRADRRRLGLRKISEGWTKYDVADLVEVHFKTVESWIKHKKELEENSYHGSKRGNPQDRRLLDNTKQQEILTAIKNTTPDEHGIEYFLWSRKAIAQFSQKKYNITLPPRRISVYTKKWGLSSQRPSKHATEQDHEKISQWMDKEYPRISKRAKKEGAQIHWCDETNININTNYQKTYAPKGQTPVVKIPARKTSYSMISSITNQGKLRYMAYKGGMNAKLFKVFLQRLVKDADGKIFLIADNLRVHHAKLVQAWQKEHSDRIELFFPTTILSTRKSR